MYPTTSLQFGMSGPEVTKLQQFLVSQGMTIPSGPTGYFGNETRAALGEWQQKTGVQAGSDFGYWGPKSIAVAAKPASPPPPAPTPVIPPSPQPTGPSIGSYQGKPITNGTQEQIQAQMRAIDAEIAAANAPIISGGDTRSDTTNSSTTIPPEVVDTETGNSGLKNLTEEQLAILYPQLKPGTTEYQDAMDKISSAYFDVMQQQMNANTEQEQQAATYNWNQLKGYIEKNLNVKLADNALQAWDQIQGLGGQFNQQNIQGSGLQQEAMDTYLNKIRRSDSLNRTASQTESDSKEQDYYRKFATPEAIRALDPQKAANWGLVPSAEMKQAMNPATLKQKYPDMSDKQIQSYIATVLDENGNYRSDLYQKHMMGANIGANNPNITTVTNPDGSVRSVDVTPSDSGQVDIDRAREQNRQEQIQKQNLNMELAKRTALGTNPQTTGAESAGPGGNQFNSPPATSGAAAAGAAAAGLGTNSTSPIPKGRYSMTLLPNGNVKRYNATTGETTQGTAEYMKQFGW